MTEPKSTVRSTAGDAGSGERVVPLRRQYLDIKQRYPDVILFFRLGDFYETFENDAIIAALYDLNDALAIKSEIRS